MTKTRQGGRSEFVKAAVALLDVHFCVCVLCVCAERASCCRRCSSTEWMPDKGLLLGLPVKQELIMKSFCGIDCLRKEQKRLM